MLAWLTDLDTLRFKLTEIFHREAEVMGKDGARRHWRQAIIEAVQKLGERGDFSGGELGPVVVFAETVLEDINRHKAELVQLKRKKARSEIALARSRQDQEDLKTARMEWEEKWNKSLAGLELRQQILPSEALDFLEIIGNCFAKLDKAKELQSRINGIDRDMNKFSGDVQALLGLLGVDFQKLTPDQAVLQLHALLGKARQDDEFLKKNDEEIDGLIVELESSAKTLLNRDGQMAELLALAKCDQSEDLVEAIRKSTEYQHIHERISEMESSLARISEGISLAEIRRQAGEVDVDELPGRIVSLKRQIEEELYPRIKGFSELIGKENNELQLMDGSAGAAEAAEKMEQVAARIRRLVDRYTLIKLAGMALKNEIERYREEHQDPVLQVASRLFSQLTLGSFKGLRADVDDDGAPVLVGMRQDSRMLTVVKMSSGTRDQLYLALRLATLEWRLQTHEPMPFIVDDILINFDDDRSKVTLKVLADLGKKNQVILFTHHRQIVEEAGSIPDREMIQIHQL